MAGTENEAQAVDWSKADNAERKKLFSVAKDIASATGTALEVLLNTALGQGCFFLGYIHSYIIFHINSSRFEISPF